MPTNMSYLVRIIPPAASQHICELDMAVFLPPLRHATPNPLSIVMMDPPSAAQIGLPPDRARRSFLPCSTEGLGYIRAGGRPAGWSRLNKFIAASGYCSRHKADELIFAGAVQVNGMVEHSPGRRILADDVIRSDSGLRLCPPLFPISCCTSPSRSCVRHTIRRGVLQFWIV